MNYQAMDIKDRVAIVTGAGSGIGNAVATALATRGAKGIALVDRSETVNELAAELHKEFPHCECRGVVGDVTDEAFRRGVFESVTAEIGLPRILVPGRGDHPGQVIGENRQGNGPGGRLPAGRLSAGYGNQP